MDKFEQMEAHHEAMQDTENKQLKYLKLQFALSCASAVFIAVMMIAVLVVVANIVPKVQAVYDSTMVSLTNLEKLTEDLNESDPAGTIQNVNKLAVQATSDLDDTMTRLNGLDLEEMNEAIHNLNATVKPLADFFSVLR